MLKKYSNDVHRILVDFFEKNPKLDLKEGGK